MKLIRFDRDLHLASFEAKNQADLDDCFRCGLCDLCAHTQPELDELHALVAKITPACLFRVVCSVVYGSALAPRDAESLAAAGVRLSLRKDTPGTPHSKIFVEVLPSQATVTPKGNGDAARVSESKHVTRSRGAAKIRRRSSNFMS